MTPPGDLLAVSWEMPPMYGPRATQVSRSLEHLAQLGWRPTVVCLAPRPGGPHWPGVAGTSGAGSAPNGVTAVRVPSPEEWLPVRAVRMVCAPLAAWPDDKWVWIGRATRAAKRAAAGRRFAGLITFAQPWSDHLIGRRLHRSLRLPWVAHFSDPWVDSPYLRGARWQRSIWQGMEAKVIEEANAVVFVNRQTADLVMRKYPAEWRRKVHVVPHGYDRDALQTTAVSDRPRRKLRLVYTGRFYEGIRTPLGLLRALDRLNRQRAVAGNLDDVEVILMGPTVEDYRGDVNAFGLGASVELKARQPHLAALEAAAEADVLVVIDAPSTTPSVFLPSKLVEYLAFRKPILGLTPPDGASADLIGRLGCPVIAPDDVGGIAEAISGLVRAWKAGTLGVSPAFDAVAAEYDIRRTTAQLHDVLHHTFNAA